MVIFLTFGGAPPVSGIVTSSSYGVEIVLSTRTHEGFEKRTSVFSVEKRFTLAM